MENVIAENFTGIYERILKYFCSRSCSKKFSFICDSNTTKMYSLNMLLWTIAVMSALMHLSAACEPVRTPMCTSMPYNLTRMPNSFHHSTQDNANLAISQFQALVNTNCSNVLRFFLCTMYVPICTEASKNTGFTGTSFGPEMIPPCRDVCLKAKEGCLPIMLRYSTLSPVHSSF